MDQLAGRLSVAGDKPLASRESSTADFPLPSLDATETGQAIWRLVL